MGRKSKTGTGLVKESSQNDYRHSSQAGGDFTEKSFEENFNRLEKILETLENQDVPLDETLKLYEEGLILTKYCYDRLTKAELRIKEINKTLKGDLEIKENKQ